jgi:hypothetical protein
MHLGGNARRALPLGVLIAIQTRDQGELGYDVVKWRAGGTNEAGNPEGYSRASE